MLGLPEGLDKIITDLGIAYRTYEAVRPTIEAVVGLLQGMHPEHAARIGAILPKTLPTEAQQDDLDDAVRKAGG